MSISAIGAVSPQSAYSAAHAAGKREATEAPGQPDHDGDSDDRRAYKVDVKA